MSLFEIKSTTRCFNGQLIRFSHLSKITNTTMTATVYIPNNDSTHSHNKYPSLLYLSGLTCTDENVCNKGGPLFKELSALKIAFIAPDTSPRGANIPGETDSWDFGVGAGFYVDATESPWSKNYKMYSYVTDELLTIIGEHFPAIDIHKMSITGHSMGGHGALTIAIKNPNKFKSVSAFAPICHPSVSPWGIKAFNGYLGSDKNHWTDYDATELILKHGKALFKDILIDVGTKDNFLSGGQLLPEDFKLACEQVGQPLTLRYQDGYDHSYFFISSFIDEHLKYHYDALMTPP